VGELTELVWAEALKNAEEELSSAPQLINLSKVSN
jgi:hypothetical protein